jgi:hypothetical protein
MMNATKLMSDAAALGLTVSTGDNRVRLSGRVGAIKKAFAMQGLSAEKAPNDTGWYMLEDDGTPVGTICAAASNLNAYAFTYNGGNLGLSTYRA